MDTMNWIAAVAIASLPGCGEPPAQTEPMSAPLQACAPAPAVVTDCRAGDAYSFLDGWTCAICTSPDATGCWTPNVRRCVSSCEECRS